jgi:outer membrane protein assembly factor BamB
MSKILVLFFFLGYVIIASCQPVGAQDWPQWRGPHRDGAAATSFRVPGAWPQALRSAWEVTIGEGHSVPVVAAGRIYTFTRRDELEVASCLDLNSGKEIWSQSYPVTFKPIEAAAAHGAGPKSTPVIKGRNLYTLGVTGIISCFDAKTGRLRWRKDFRGRFKVTYPQYGTAMSPLVDRDLLITHVGFEDNGSLIAFDSATGAEKWVWSGDGPCSSSPVIAELGGVRQVITQTQKFMIGIAQASGELLWKIPFSTEYDSNAVTPIVFGDTVIYSGLDKGTSAIRIARDGAKWTTEQVWHNSDISMYLSSPVLRADLLFGFSHRRKGELFCLNARTGTTVWTSVGRQADNVAVVIAGETLFLLADNAELTIARAAGERFQPLKKYTVATSPTWAHPVVIGNRILIKDKTKLALLMIE